MFEAHFQTFEEPEGGVALTARLAAFREELARRKLTGFVIPRADQQQNEYVAPSEERLAWLTGFTGSAGIAIVLTQASAVFVDGRYTLQAAKQVDAKAWSVEPLIDPSPESWLAKHLGAGDRLGFDPWLHTSAAAERLALAQTAASRSAAAEVCSHGSNPRRSPAPRCFASQLSGEGSISGSTLQAFASTCFAACSVYRPSTNTAAACVNTIAIPADPVNPVSHASRSSEGATYSFCC